MPSVLDKCCRPNLEAFKFILEIRRADVVAGGREVFVVPEAIAQEDRFMGERLPVLFCLA